MSNQVKVKNTEKYSDSQGTHIVCKGKLLFIKSEEAHNSLFYDDGGKSYYYKPTTISETEEIEVGDWAYNPYDSTKTRFLQCAESNKDSIQEHWNKVLALPEHFSDKHLQAIVDGKMKDGDEVFIKCERHSDQHPDWRPSYNNPDDPPIISWDMVHLDQQNHITLFPAKHSLEEASKKFRDEFDTTMYNEIQPTIADVLRQRKIGFEEGVEWAKKNNY